MKHFKILLFVLAVATTVAPNDSFALAKIFGKVTGEGLHALKKAVSGAGDDTNLYTPRVAKKHALSALNKANTAQEVGRELSKQRVALIIDTIRNSITRPNGFDPLMKAIVDDDIEEVRRLIAEGEIDLEAVRKEKTYYDGFLISGGESYFLLASMTGNKKIMRELQKAGFPADLEDNRGVRSLMVSVLRNDLEATRISLAAGANPNIKSPISTYDFPVIMAIDAGNPWMVEVILASGKVNMEIAYKGMTLGSALVKYSDMLRSSVTTRDIGDKIAEHLFKVYKLGLFQ